MKANTLNAGKVKADLTQVKWSPKLESILEDILMMNQFDFKLAAKEFCNHLNLQNNQSNNFFVIDGKNLQLKWTDIEIRRHVLPKMEVEEEIKR